MKNNIYKELENLNIEKAPTKYLLSLFRRTKREQYCLYDFDYDVYIDKNKYNLMVDWEKKLKDILKTKEHIVTSKVLKKQIRQKAAKRKH